MQRETKHRRNIDVDCAKAIGIILMVVGHSSCALPHMREIIYMFHMPLFYFCSGFCLKEDYLKKPVRFIWQKIKGIYWPYVVGCLAFLFLHNFFVKIGIISGMAFSSSDTLGYLPDILFRMRGEEELINTYWFLRALFIGAIVAYGILFCTELIGQLTQRMWPMSYRFQSRINVVLKCCSCLSLLLITLYVNYTRDTLTIFHFTPQILLAAVFFQIGHIFSCMNVNKFNLVLGIFAIAFLIIGSFFWETEMSWLYHDSRKLLPYIITAVLGTWIVLSIPWDKVPDRILRVINVIGNNTLAIMTWHLLCFKFVSWSIINIYALPLDNLVAFPTLHEYAMKGWWLVYALVGIMLPVISNMVWKCAWNYSFRRNGE